MPFVVSTRICVAAYWCWQPSVQFGPKKRVSGRQPFKMLVHARCSCTIVDKRDWCAAVKRVALGVAVAESRPDVSQIACANWLTAQHAGNLPERRPAIHQYESHVAPPNAKQNTISDGLEPLGGGAHRWFLPSGLSLFRSTFWGGIGMYFPSSLRFA